MGANIKESQGSQNKADFTSKMSIACKEARETLYWLKLFSASGQTTESKLSDLTKESNELITIFTSIVKKNRACPPANKPHLPSHNSQFSPLTIPPSPCLSQK